jgi:hypothetical protein
VCVGGPCLHLVRLATKQAIVNELCRDLVESRVGNWTMQQQERSDTNRVSRSAPRRSQHSPSGGIERGYLIWAASSCVTKVSNKITLFW